MEDKDNPTGQLIQGVELTEEHVGCKVTYVPRHANGNASHPDSEGGHIKRWNDRFCFVTYTTGTKATNFEDLVFG